MPKLKETGESPDYLFYCPGCKCDHGLWTSNKNGNNVIWKFNGDLNKPTVTPSLLIKHGKNIVCHLFIKEGMLKYLHDCSHELAGETIEMEDYTIH